MTPAAPPAWLKAAPALFLVLWSSGFVVLKVGLAYADPLTFLALRYACVLLILTPLLLALRPPLPTRASAWGHLAMVGLLLQAGYFCFTYLSLKQGMSAGGVALITSLQPILIGLLAPALAHERVDARRWTGLALGVTGAEIDIRPAAEQMLRDIGHAFSNGEPVHEITFENVQAGLRTDYLFRLANQNHGFVLGTGDLSELALG